MRRGTVDAAFTHAVQAADFDLAGANTVQEPFGELSLMPRGENIRVQLAAPGIFRFHLKPMSTGAALTIRRLETH